MNNDNKVETEIAGLNCWASYATGNKQRKKYGLKLPVKSTQYV